MAYREFLKEGAMQTQSIMLNGKKFFKFLGFLGFRRKTLVLFKKSLHLESVSHQFHLESVSNQRSLIREIRTPRGTTPRGGAMGL